MTDTPTVHETERLEMKSQPDVKNRRTRRSESRISVGRKADSRRGYAAKPLAVLLIAVMLLSAVPLVRA